MHRIVVAGDGTAVVDALVERLAASPVFADCRRVPPGKDPDEADCDTLVYVAEDLGGGPAVEVAAAVLERLAGGVRHLVVLSSAAVHVPSAHHPGFVAEDRPASRRHRNRIAERWRELERLALAAVARDAVEGGAGVLTVLRPTAIVAAGNGYFSRLLAGRWAFPLPGFDPTLQLMSLEDVASATVRVVEAGTGDDYRGGVYHLAPGGVVPLRTALRAAGVRRLPLPYPLQWLARGLFATSGRAAPVDRLAYVSHSWTVSDEAARRRFSWRPERSSVAALRELGAATVAEEPDDFGMDRAYIARLGRTLFRFLHDVWWRVEWRGLERVPRAGRAVLAGVHRGHQPYDGVMALHLLVRELGRYPRFLIHPTLVKFSFLAPFMFKCGGVPANRENAAWVLERDRLLAIFPEGIRGAFTMYRDAYRLGSYGSAEYVRIALRHRAPIVPFATVGSAEIFPILGRIDWRWFQRVTEWPFLPITPTMSTVPLPSKWHTWFLEPVEIEDYPRAAADDPAAVREIDLEVRRRIEAAIAEMLRRRKSIFWGSILSSEGDREPAPSP